MALSILKRVCVLLVIFYLFFALLSRSPKAPNVPFQVTMPKFQEPLRIPIKHTYANSSDKPLYYGFDSETEIEIHLAEESAQPLPNEIKASAALLKLTTCSIPPNRFTKHIRLPNLLYNISMTLSSSNNEHLAFWNPTILSLPKWAANQYLILSMVSPNDLSSMRLSSKEKVCTEEDLNVLGLNGGLRCVTSPREVDVPPTPAERCEGMEIFLADIPGFHDPRSQYKCIGLWIIDLRILHPSLSHTFSSSPRRLGPGPLISYPTLTELTRNPLSTRRSYEKNWVIFSPSPSTSYIQYELNSTTRTFAQLIGAGFTTTNLTSPLESPCLFDPTPDEVASAHHYDATSWHQATPSLKLILCVRTNQICLSKDGGPEMVFFAAVQRKHLNGYGLPARYERYFVVWSAESPFDMMAISSHPILFFNETARGWSDEEIWDDISSLNSPNSRVSISSSSISSSSFFPRDLYND